jgi:glycosyltransferase involved in cell wall biosynthesis
MMSGGNAAASVVMTVYNGERHLRAAIESIRAQTVADLELVIVDDGSTDGTAGILVQARSDPRIRVVTARRIGRPAALNLAWRNARSEFIANLDADDLAEPDRIEKQLGFLSSHSEVGLLGTAWKRFLGDDRGWFITVRPPLTSRELRQALIRRYPFYHSSTMFTRAALEAVGGYNERFRVCLDYEITTRIACRFEVANLPDVLTWQRIHSSQFFSGIKAWDRYRAVLSIRWLAWSTFSRRPGDLLHVANGWPILREYLGAWLKRRS